jgi:ribosome-associated protein
MIPVETDNLDHDEAGRPSKTQRKRAMDALQQLGEELLTLPVDRLARLPIPDVLRLAVQDARRFTKHEARRRQMQYIGRLMREIDPAPIRAALDEVHGVSAAATARQHRLEQLRDRLLEDEQVLGEIANGYPGADLQHLRQLRRNALRERNENKPPRAFRELFRALRELHEPEAQAGSVEEIES